MRKKIVWKLLRSKQVRLEIIEVQTGTKVCEDDIKRYEDIYGRV